MTATFDEFVNSLIVNGEKSGWTSQSKSGAYGKFQIMPLNWKNWSAKALATIKHPHIWAQLKTGRQPVAAKNIPVAQWWPHPSQRNQTDVARWRLQQIWDNTGQDAPRVAAIWQGGHVGPDPATWTSRQRKYANRVCVPLGYPPLTP